MSPDSGEIYGPGAVEELKKRAPTFAGTLIELTGEEAERLQKLNRKDRRAALRGMRRSQKKRVREFA